MSKKALKFLPNDNVVVALEDVSKNDCLRINGEETDVCARIALPQGHKIAITDIPEGGEIRKYGHVIGFAAQPIVKGDYVHVHNVQDTITDWRGQH